MKKILTLVMIVVMVFSVIGCGDEGKIDNDVTAKESNDEEVNFQVNEDQNENELDDKSNDNEEQESDETSSSANKVNLKVNEHTFELKHPNFKDTDLIDFFYLTPDEIFAEMNITKDYLEEGREKAGTYNKRAYIMYDQIVLYFDSLENNSDFNKKNLLEISGTMEGGPNLSLNLSNGDVLTKGTSVDKIRETLGKEFMLRSIFHNNEELGKEIVYLLKDYNGEFSNEKRAFDTIQLAFHINKGSKTIEFLRIGLADKEKLIKEKNIEDMNNDETKENNTNDNYKYQYSINGKGFKITNPNIDITNIIDFFSYTNKEFLTQLSYPEDYLESNSENVGTYQGSTYIHEEGIVFFHAIGNNNEDTPLLIKFSSHDNNRVNLEMTLEDGTKIKSGMKDTEVIEILGDEHYYGPMYDEEERIIGEEITYIIENYNKDFYSKGNDYNKMILSFKIDQNDKTIQTIGASLVK